LLYFEIYGSVIVSQTVTGGVPVSSPERFAEVLGGVPVSSPERFAEVLFGIFDYCHSGHRHPLAYPKPIRSTSDQDPNGITPDEIPIGSR